MKNTELTVAGLYTAWQQLSANEIIIDIRSADDFRSAHVPGSLNIPFAKVTDHLEELKRFDKVYFYCYTGQGSKATTAKLTDMGLSNLCYVGQPVVDGWKAAGYPLG